MDTKTPSPFLSAVYGVATIILLIGGFYYLASTMPKDDLAGRLEWAHNAH